MINQITKMISLILLITILICNLCFSISALSWDGDNANTGGLGFDATSKGYAIRFTEDNCIGYRFSVVDIDGNTRNGAVIDIFRNTQYGNSQYTNGYKFTVKYNKKQLINHQYDTFSTSRNSYNCYFEYNMGFASALPTPSGMNMWQNDGRNLNSVLLTLGINNISDLNYGDKVIVEPIYDIRLEGIYHAVTVSELAVYGQSCFGTDYNGGSSYTSDTWGFIAAYTNKHYPNELYTPDGQGLWEGASVLSRKASFGVILNKGYGVGIAYTEVNKRPADSLKIEAIPPNAVYKEGTEVITAFKVYNESDYDIYPDSGITVDLGVYIGSDLIEFQTLSEVAIPANESNLVWFKWTVPYDLGKSDLTVSGTVCDKDEAIHIDSMIARTSPLIYSQTPDTKYESHKPDGYTIPHTPHTMSGEVTWSVWECIDDDFEYVEYGIMITDDDPYITPDKDSPSAVYSNGIWTMRSGYGFTIEYAPTVSCLEYCAYADLSAYTEVQQAYVTFPEFAYDTLTDEFRTLEITEEGWNFIENEYADEHDRLHFTPLWFPNDSYIVSVTATDVWTPAGMISSVRNSNTIKILDSAYDDWYVGEG